MSGTAAQARLLTTASFMLTANGRGQAHARQETGDKLTSSREGVRMKTGDDTKVLTPLWSRSRKPTLEGSV